MSIELDVKLIKYVQRFPFLYYKGAMNYNNELLLANTWIKIGADLKVNPEYCMIRWKYLRRRYTREPQFALPEKEWTLMKYLRFLEPFIHRRKPSDRLSEAPSTPVSECELNVCEYRQNVPSETFSGAERENDRYSSASESTTLPLKLSNDSFCQSLSNSLQSLTTDQQVSCRIDILVVIEKYLSSVNVEDVSNSTNSTPSSCHSRLDHRLDMLASDVSKRFAEILNKMKSSSISSFDEDWLIIFTVKNFFCKLLEMRKLNSELDAMLPPLVSVDTASHMVEEHGRHVVSAPRTTAKIKKPVCMNRRSELSKVDGKNEPQTSSISNPQSANSVTIKTEIADCTQFQSSECVSQKMQHLSKSNPGLINSSPTWKPVPQVGVCQHPVHSDPVPGTRVETHPIETESTGTQLLLSEPVSQNLQSASNNNNSNNISLKPSLAKNIPEFVPAVTTNNVSLVRPARLVKIISNSTVSSQTSNSAFNSSLPDSATNWHFSNFSTSRSISGRSVEFENAVHETLKKINSIDSSHGFMQDGDRFLCVLCNIWFPSTLYKRAHTHVQNHKNYIRNYFLHCSRVMKTALPRLDLSLYVLQSDGLFCIKCKAMMKGRMSFQSHITCAKHKNQLKNLPRYVDLMETMISSIDQVIVEIGSFNYCVLCNVKLFDSPAAEHISSARHQEQIALLKGIFKIDRHAYCSYCNEKFPQTELTLHVNKGKHASKISFYDSRLT